METLKKLSTVLLITAFIAQALYAGVDASKLKNTDDKQALLPLLIAVCIATMVTCEAKGEQTTSDGTKTSGTVKVEVKK